MGYTPDDRYRINCSYCGFLYSETKLIDAITTATRMLSRHDSEGETIEIFDAMAHIGRPVIYTALGKPVAYRFK